MKTTPVGQKATQNSTSFLFNLTREKSLTWSSTTHENYNGCEIAYFIDKHKKTASGKLTKGFNKEAEDALPLGPPEGGNAMIDPDDGTIEVCGPSLGTPPDSEGEGAGANIESGPTDVGGATSGGNCWDPANFLLR